MILYTLMSNKIELNFPNVLTIARIALIPLFAIIFYLPFEWARPMCALLFAIAGLTDWLDGYLARKMNLVSKFGEFLDPVADKLLVSIALVLLVSEDTTRILVLPACIIIGREIMVSALRHWVALANEAATLDVTYIAKVKTFSQFFALVLLLYQDSYLGVPLYEIGIILLYIATLLTVISLVRYILRTITNS